MNAKTEVENEFPNYQKCLVRVNKLLSPILCDKNIRVFGTLDKPNSFIEIRQYNVEKSKFRNIIFRDDATDDEILFLINILNTKPFVSKGNCIRGKEI